MLPYMHALLGAIFALMVWLFLPVTPLTALIIFLAAVFIDVDHYITYAIQRNDWSLASAYQWHKNLVTGHKPIMHILHSVEFLFLIFILGFFIPFFMFIFIGCTFHSILDLVEMGYCKHLGREHSLLRYLIKRKTGVYNDFS